LNTENYTANENIMIDSENQTDAQVPETSFTNPIFKEYNKFSITYQAFKVLFYFIP